MLQNRILAFLLLAFTQLLVEIPGTGAKVPALIVFGDSTVDSGNNNQISTVLKSNFQPYGRDFFDGKATGRFSNGRIAPDFISEGLGLKNAVPAYLDPSYDIKDFATGVCFASAGTGLDNATSDVLVSQPQLHIFRFIHTPTVNIKFCFIINGFIFSLHMFDSFILFLSLF